MRYDFNETFTDIDDKLIANAKPMAQKPMELRAAPRSKSIAWKKIAAAAACLAVVGTAGGVIAVKANGGLSSVSSSAGDQISSAIYKEPAVYKELPTIGLGQYYESIQGISKYLTHNDSEIFDPEDDNVKFNIINSGESNGVKFFVGSEGDVYGLSDNVNIIAAVENTSDKAIGIYVPYSRDTDTEDGKYFNLAGTHSEITVKLENGGAELKDDTDEDHFLDDPHILMIEPGETYYQAMSFSTYPDAERVDVSTGTYNGTASVNLVSDSGDVSVNSLDFSIEVSGREACTDLFINNGQIDDVNFSFYDGAEALYKKDGVYLYNGDGSLDKIYGGEYVKDFYIYDFNGDGKSDVLSTVTESTGIDVVYGYDKAHDWLYEIREEGFGFSLDRDNGLPIVRKFGADGAEVSSEPLDFDMFKAAVIAPSGTDSDRKKWYDGTEFEYNGKIYKVIDSAFSSTMTKDTVNDLYAYNDLVTTVIGVRREIIDGVDTVEFVAAVMNEGSEPIGLMSSVSSPDKPILFKFEVESVELPNSHHVFDDEEFKFMPVVIQPGETYYQTASIPVTENAYRFSHFIQFTDPDKFNENGTYEENSRGYFLGNRWANFIGKSDVFDDVYELFHGESILPDGFETSENN